MSKDISSAGLGALVGKPADPHSVNQMKKRGIDISRHRARQLTEELLNEADIVLVMEKSHIEAISNILPQVRGKTMLLGRWLDEFEVPDPYGKSEEAFIFMVDAVSECVQSWISYLK